MDSIFEKSTETRLLRRGGVRIYAHSLIWIIAANVGILTTKYLLTAGYNYPLHLLLVHLAAAISLEVVGLLFCTFVEGPRTIWSTLRPQIDGSQRLLFALAFAGYLVTTAAATMLAYQAVEHFRTVSAVVTTLICVTQPWNIYLQAAWIDKRGAGYLAVFAISIVSVYLFDAKLTFKGVGSAALAAGFATAAEAQKRWLLPRWNTDDSTLCATQQRMLSLAAFIVALAVTALSCWKWETPIYSPLAGHRVVWILIVNIGSSALAFTLGWSPIWMLHSSHDTPDEHNAILDGPRLSILPSWIALAITSTASTVFHMSFSMNKGQYAGCFFMMEAVLAMRRQSQLYARQEYASDGDDAAQVSLLSAGEPFTDSESAPSPRDVEANVASKSFLSPPSKSRRSYLQSLQLSMILRATIMLVLCLGLTYFDMENSFMPSKEPGSRIKNGDNSSQSFDLVVSYYDEPVSEVAWQLKELTSNPALRNLNISIIIYNKGNTTTTTTRTADLRENLTQLTGFTPDIIDRPNIGKESETYLHHMVSRWDSLATHTFFMQAHMHNFFTSQQRISQYFVPQTGFLPLSPLEACGSFDACTDHSTWSEESDILERIFNGANMNRELEALLLTYRGQFIASSSRIRANGQEHYWNLLAELRDEKSYTHSADYAVRPWMPGKTDSMNAPLFGYTIERMWPAIFQCSELRVLRDCPSLASGFLRSFVPSYTPRVEDCQCLDTL